MVTNVQINVRLEPVPIGGLGMCLKMLRLGTKTKNAFDFLHFVGMQVQLLMVEVDHVSLFVPLQFRILDFSLTTTQTYVVPLALFIYLF